MCGRGSVLLEVPSWKRSLELLGHGVRSSSGSPGDIIICCCRGHEMGGGGSSRGAVRRRPRGQEAGVDVRDDASTRDRDLGHILVQLLIGPNGQLDVAGHDAVLPLVLHSIASQLQDLSCHILNDGGEHHTARQTDALRIASALQVLREAVDGKGELGPLLDAGSLGSLVILRSGLRSLAGLDLFRFLIIHASLVLSDFDLLLAGLLALKFHSGGHSLNKVVVRGNCRGTCGGPRKLCC
mmetsp:Transcript_21858/g.32695  ORF Transcript_21858/g.32695 Transcript_21858/m.32695 type:complete len:239 (-) Transcript_21858:158-874(-)